MASSTATVPPIVRATGFPAAQWSTLQNMAQNNELNGVPPEYLVAIWVAEGRNTATHATNSAGYGGWFGTSNASGNFAQQAQSASRTYAQGIEAAINSSNGGTLPQYAPVVAAENYYQTGNIDKTSNGAGVFSQFIGENLISGSTPTVTVSKETQAAVGLSYIPGTSNFVGASNSQLQAVQDCTQASVLGQCSVGSQPCALLSLGPVSFNKCQAKALLSGLFVASGAVLMLAGLALLFEGGSNAVGNAAQLGLNAVPGGVVVQKTIKSAAKRGSVPQQSRADQNRVKGAQHAQAMAKGRQASARRPVGRSVPAYAGGEDDF